MFTNKGKEIVYVTGINGLSLKQTAMLVALVSELDPDEYMSDIAKATIYQCRAIMGEKSDRHLQQ